MSGLVGNLEYSLSRDTTRFTKAPSFVLRYSYDDKELRNVMTVNKEFTELFNGTGILEDLVPAVQYVWESKKYRRVKEITKELILDYIGQKFDEHKNTFDKGLFISHRAETVLT